MVREICEHRIARRAAYAFSDTVDKAQREHAAPCARNADEWACGGRQRIAEYDDRLSPPPAIGEPAGNDFQDAADGLSSAFDDAKRYGGGTEDGREKKRQQRINRLAGDVVQQADEAK